MLPATVMAGATEVARRLKDAVAALRVEHAGALSGVLTVKRGDGLFNAEQPGERTGRGSRNKRPELSKTAVHAPAE